jgi:hypothetical protein
MLAITDSQQIRLTFTNNLTFNIHLPLRSITPTRKQITYSETSKNLKIKKRGIAGDIRDIATLVFNAQIVKV